jgi:O-antigen ligase
MSTPSDEYNDNEAQGARPVWGMGEERTGERRRHRSNKELRQAAKLAPEYASPFRPRICRREKVVAAFILLTLLFMPWALGSMRPWTQITACSLAVAAMLALFIPLGKERQGQSPTALDNLKRLLTFPIFWLGVLFLVYLLLQAINPAWQVMITERFRRVYQVAHNPALPSGVAADFWHMNTYRVMIMMGGALALTCALWVGVNRRRTVHLLLGVFAINAVVVGLFALIQRATGAKEIFWSVYAEGANFYGPFFYRNHAGSYLYLAFAVALGLAFYAWRRQRERGSGSGLQIMWFVLALMTGAAAALTLSRGALFLTGLVALVGLLFFLLSLRPSDFRAVAVIPTLIILGLLAAVITYQVQHTDIEALQKKIARHLEDPSAELRPYMMEATVVMIQDQPVWGWGAGSYRYISPYYFTRYPIFVHPRTNRLRAFANYAHCDWLQYPMEFGYAGVSLLGLMLFYWFMKILTHWRGLTRFSLMLLAGCLTVFIHASFEFIFYNPAILYAYIFVLAAAVKLIVAERRSLLAATS